MADETGAAASPEPVIAPLPTPISVEPRVAAPAEAAEVARQAEEAKVAANAPKKPAEPAPTKDEPKKLPSIRDSIRAAEAKLNAQPAAEKASPLKADPNVAEPAAKVEPAAKADPKAAKAAEPVRAADGKFVSAKPAADSAAPVADAAKTAEPAPTKPAALPSHTAEAPPARFSAAAKERWAEAPDEVRAEVTRMTTELTKGFEKHRAAAERDGELAEFHEMATKGGTTVKEALSKYVNMENVLRADPIKGLELIAQNAGLSLRDVAAKILNQAPDAIASAADANVRRLEAEIAELKKGFGTIQQERTQAKTDTTTQTVTQFAAAHPRFDELAEDIAFFLKTRTKDLAEAYTLAERLNPAPAKEAPVVAAPATAASSAPVAAIATLVAPAASSAQDDRGQKSIAGAPSAGSDPVRKQPSSTIREALLRAKQRAG